MLSLPFPTNFSRTCEIGHCFYCFFLKARELSKRFKAISEQEQAKYDTMAKAAKKKYVKAMAEYKRTLKGSAKNDGSSSDEDSSSDSDLE